MGNKLLVFGSRMDYTYYDNRKSESGFNVDSTEFVKITLLHPP